MVVVMKVPGLCVGSDTVCNYLLSAPKRSSRLILQTAKLLDGQQKSGHLPSAERSSSHFPVSISLPRCDSPDLSPSRVRRSGKARHWTAPDATVL